MVAPSLPRHVPATLKVDAQIAKELGKVKGERILEPAASPKPGPRK